MTEKNNATCSICGRPYHLCVSCKDMMSLSPWKIHTDTSEHYKIYQVIHGFNTGVYTKEEAKSKLQKVDLSDFDSLRENIKNIIQDIMKEDKKIVETVVKTIDLSNDFNMAEDTTENVVDVIEDIVEDTDVSVSDDLKTVRKRKSSKVVETE